jgi:hypothetical protein
MKLPNFEHAIIPEHKIVGYLLSLSHRDGRGESGFLSALRVLKRRLAGQRRYGGTQQRIQWFESRIRHSGIVMLSKDQSWRQTVEGRSFG